MSEARHSPPAGAGPPRPGQQPLDGDLSYKAILRFTVGLMVLIAVSAGLMWLLTVGLRDRVAAQDPPPPVLPEARMRYEPPAPRLQPSPQEELRAMQAEDDAALGAYAWVDEAAGIARVPIERAMELLVARGGASIATAAPTPAAGAGTGSEDGTEATGDRPAGGAPESTAVEPAEGES